MEPRKWIGFCVSRVYCDNAKSNHFYNSHLSRLENNCGRMSKRPTIDVRWHACLNYTPKSQPQNHFISGTSTVSIKTTKSAPVADTFLFLDVAMLRYTCACATQRVTFGLVVQKLREIVKSRLSIHLMQPLIVAHYVQNFQRKHWSAKP